MQSYIEIIIIHIVQEKLSLCIRVQCNKTSSTLRSLSFWYQALYGRCVVIAYQLLEVEGSGIKDCIEDVCS